MKTPRPLLWSVFIWPFAWPSSRPSSNMPAFGFEASCENPSRQPHHCLPCCHRPVFVALAGSRSAGACVWDARLPSQWVTQCGCSVCSICALCTTGAVSPVETEHLKVRGKPLCQKTIVHIFTQNYKDSSAWQFCLCTFPDPSASPWSPDQKPESRIPGRVLLLKLTVESVHCSSENLV